MDLKLPIYLDYNATTPVDPQVLEEMLPYFCEKFGNASSKSHKFGWEASYAVEVGRDRIAKLINASPKEIVFTSGSTESINLAIKGIADTYASKGKHIITTPLEHNAVIDTCNCLAKAGYEIDFVNIDKYGIIDLNHLNDLMRDDTVLVSVIMANNEIGVIQPIKEISQIVHSKNAFFHVDGSQSVGKIPVDVHDMDIDIMAITSHKLYGPKGIGGLFVKDKDPKIKLTEQISGGGHEFGMRSGTLNVPGIVGFGKACEICMLTMEEETNRVSAMRDNMISELTSNLERVFLNGHPVYRLPGNANMCFECVETSHLFGMIDDVAFSSGSACSSAKMKPSHVLKALGLTDDQAVSSIRIGIGRYNTQEEVDYATKRLIETVNKVREKSPKWEMALKSN
ncbi:MAG TPA: IscS subfamily cysteine desulfurase [Bacteroidetes bacterium]|nr:IscS subfamily cysteine desulfurase [Bacteroidota bacterium]HCN36892.1 IscS subfamily cysteine desulfurase [Bacteroidota bacterium]